MKDNCKKEKINVLEFIGGLDRGGAETYLINTIRNINKEQFNIYIGCYGEKKFDYEEIAKTYGATIIRFKKPSHSFDISLIIQIKKSIINNNIKVVHAHTYYNSLYPIIAAKLSNVKRIITHSHNTKPEQTNNLFKKIYFSLSKKIINSQSTDLLACGEEAGKSLFTKNFSIINNGIPINDYLFSESIRTRKRKELKISKDSFVVCHVGRFEEQKNHKQLIEIFNDYLKKNKKATLLLIGDGPLKKEIEDKINKLGISKNVIFLGKRQDVNELYSAADLLLFPSLYEGLPLTLIEAQINGLPIIASSTIDKSVNISDNILFIDKDDKKKWVDAIKNRKRYNCVDKIIKNGYDANHTTQQLEAIYLKGTL